jgi:serine phosphatase RsbU (regulator of sigma subunit)
MTNVLNNAKVLLIDDSKLNRAVIKNTLSELSMTITECNDGQEGLDAIKKERFDIILVDTVMPVMDGLTFLKEIKQGYIDDFIPVILMTGNDDLNSKIKGLNVGADDFLQKPINQKELVARVMSLLRLKKTHDQLYLKNKQIEKEMEAAKKVQEFIIPDDFSGIPYPSISGKYLPMENIGGDFFDFYPLENNRTGLLIADVTGHGIPAALIVTMTKMVFNVYAEKYDSTAALLTKVNSDIKKMLLENQYITAFYGIYDNKNKTFTFTNAGHIRPFYYRKRTGKILMLDSFGFFIGILDDPKYEQKTIKVEEGDRLFLLTDGVTELKNSAREDFGDQRLAKFISDNKDIKGNEFCNKLLEVLMSHIIGAEKSDDLAFLNIEF